MTEIRQLREQLTRLLYREGYVHDEGDASDSDDEEAGTPESSSMSKEVATASCDAVEGGEEGAELTSRVIPGTKQTKEQRRPGHGSGGFQRKLQLPSRQIETLLRQVSFHFPHTSATY